MEWLINRRRMMFNRSTPPAYITFEDPVVWEICCTNWGDYNETVITAGDSENTVNIVESFVSKRNTLEKSRVVLNTQTSVDNSGGTYTIGTTKEAVGITKKQCAAVTSLQTKFKNNTQVHKFNEFKYFTSVTKFEGGAFQYCTSLTEITFPYSIKETYGGNVFNNCTAMTTMNINEGLENINSNYFIWDCKALTKLVIPTTLKRVLQNGLSLSSGSYKYTLIMLPTTPPVFTGAISYPASIKEVYVPDDSLTAYKEAQYWSAIASKIYPMSDYAES